MTILLEDTFTTADAAPISPAAPRTCEGTGYLNITSTVLGISGGELVHNGSLSSLTGWIAANSDGSDKLFTRANGLTMLWKTPTRTTTTTACRFGWHTSGLSSNSQRHGVEYTSVNTIQIRDANVAVDTFAIGAGIHEFAVMQMSTGGLLFYRVGTDDWTLQWVYRSESDDCYSKMVVSTNTSVNFTLDDLRIKQMSGSSWETLDGLAALNQASVANSTQYTAVADGVIEMRFTAPASITQAAYYRFRVIDANNYLRVGYNSSGAFRLDRVTAGVATNLINVNSAITGGTSATVRVVLNGSDVRCYTLASGATAWAKRGSTQTESQGSTETAVVTDLGNWSAANLFGYNRTSSTYEELTTTNATIDLTRLEPSGVLYAPTLEPGGATINITRLESSAALYPPVVEPGNVTLSMTRLEPSSTIYTPTVEPGNATISLTRLEPSGSLYSPTLEAGSVTVNVDRLEPSGTIFTPSIEPGEVTVSPARLESSSSIFTPDVEPGNVTVNPARLEPSAELYTPTVEAGGVTVAITRLEPSAVIYTPTISNSGGGDATINLTRLEPSAVLYAPTLEPGAVSIDVTRLEASGGLYTPTLAAGSVTISVTRLEPSAQLYAPALVPGGVEIAVQRLEPSAQIYTLTIEAGAPARSVTVEIIPAGTVTTSINTSSATVQVTPAGSVTVEVRAAGTATVEIIPAGRVEVDIL